MKSKISVVFLALMLLLIPTTVSKGTNSLEIDLTIRVFAYRDESPVNGSQITIYTDSGTFPCGIDPTGTLSCTIDPTTENEYRFKESINEVDRIERITISVTPPSDYILPHKIRLRRQARETNSISRQIDVYVVEKGTRVHFDDLARIRTYLEEDKLEKALALAEYAYDITERPDVVRQYLVRLDYAYARALQNSCKKPEYGYETCRLARGIFERLDSWCGDERYTDIFDLERITAETISTAIKDIDEYEQAEKERLILQSYDGIDEAFARGGLDYGEAARKIEEILRTYPENREIWEKNGKPERDLHRDAGLAWLNYGIFVYRNPTLAKDDLTAVFTKSIDHLERAIQLGDESDNTLNGLKRAQTYLQELQRATPTPVLVMPTSTP